MIVSYLTVFGSHHKDIATVALNGEVARHADDFKESDVVTIEEEAVGGLNFAKHGDVMIYGVDGDDGVVKQACAQFFLNRCGKLGTCLALCLDLPNAWEVDHAVGFYRVI